MKKIFQLLSLATVVGLMVWGCKDNFSEQDFLNAQTKAKTRQDSILYAAAVAAMNASGQLMSYTLQVLDDKSPVAGVAAVMSNGSGATATSATTDANGFATFKKVQMGSNTVVVSKTGYFPATFIVDFGTPQNGTNYISNYINGNYQIIPIPVDASNQVPIFATSAGSTGTIRGNVWIETDLTNMTPEIPQNITLKANLASIASGVGGTGNVGSTAGGQATIVQYYFNTGSIGSAAVDNTTGAYSMVVPAGAEGRNVTMVYPVITTTQKVGFQMTAGVSVAPQISSTVPVVYGPSALVGGYDAVPIVNGVNAVFTPAAPPAPGNGLKLTLAVVPRSLTTGFLDGLGFTPQTLGSIQYAMTNRGSGYTASPVVTVTGGGASTQATMSSSLAGVATGVTITAGGANYTGSINLQLQQTNDGVNFFNTTDAASNPINFNMDVGVTPIALTGLTFTLPTSGPGFASATPFQTAYNTGGTPVTGFRWSITGGGAGTGATATATVSCYVDFVLINSGGTGYTSAPSIDIAAPSSGTKATMAVTEFNTQWTVAMDNSANTSPYKVMPGNVTLTFVSNVGTNGGNSNIIDQFNQVSTLFGNLTVSGGSVVFADATKTYKTQGFSGGAPFYTVQPSVSTSAVASVNVVSGLTSLKFGQVSSVSGINAGSGYDVPLSIAITPVTGTAGSGAKVDITPFVTYNSGTKAYNWNANSFLTAPGSGYQPYLNMFWAYYPAYSGSPGTSPVNFSGSTTITVRTGDVIVNDVNFGTGAKKMSIN